MSPVRVGTKNHNNLNTYEPMLIILLIFGYNFDFYEHNIYLKILAKLYCVSLVGIISYATLNCCHSQGISEIWSLLEYSSSVLIILLFKSKMREFLEKINDIDVYLRVKRKHYFWDKNKIFIVTLIVWIVRAVYTMTYCIFVICYQDFLLYMITMFSLLALDLNRVWRCLVYDAIRYRLKLLRIRLEEGPNDNYYLYVRNKKSLREDKIKFCMFLYRSIADMVELVLPELHASLIMSVLCSLPKLIYNVYHILTVIEEMEPYDSLGFTSMHLVQICVLLFTPFLIVELCSIEVEQIRLFLTHKYMDEDDKILKKELKTFLQYTALRPFRYRIWRMIPVNLTLPLALINICTTYVIVVINFTHLYG